MLRPRFLLFILPILLCGLGGCAPSAPNTDTRTESTTEENIQMTADNLVQQGLVIYPAPAGRTASPDVTLKVNGQDVFVYETAVNNTHKWEATGHPPQSSTPVAYFDCDTSATLEVEMSGIDSIDECILRPLSSGITPKIEGNKVSFDIQGAGFYTLEFNGSPERAFHIFVNPIERDIPDKNDPSIIFIEAGEHEGDDIWLQSGQTLYIAGGAVFYGKVYGVNVDNITIRGRGIIDGSKFDTWLNKDGVGAKVPVDLNTCDNVSAEGIILLNSNAWCFNCFEVSNALISNVKIISSRPNGDGFTLQSCNDVEVRDSFVRTWDDSLVVKNYSGNSSHISFNNIQIWTDLAQSLEIGYETNKGKRENSIISDIVFENITVLNNFHKPVISIHNSDDAVVENITYRNIVVENAQMGKGDANGNDELIDFAIIPSQWTSVSSNAGIIRNITVENVTVLDGRYPSSRLWGADEGHRVEDVRIKNLVILGQKVTSLKDGRFKVNDFAGQVEFE